VTPVVVAALALQAAAHGRGVEAHVAGLIEEAAGLPPVHPPEDRTAQDKRPRPPGRKSLAQLFADSPFRGLDLDFERDRDVGRNIAL
jgi:plasmid stability protein